MAQGSDDKGTWQTPVHVKEASRSPTWCLDRDALREEIHSAFEELVLPLLSTTAPSRMISEWSKDPVVDNIESRITRSRNPSFDVVQVSSTPKGIDNQPHCRPPPSPAWEPVALSASGGSANRNPTDTLPLDGVVPGAIAISNHDAPPQIPTAVNSVSKKDAHPQPGHLSSDGEEYAGRARLDYVQELLGNNAKLSVQNPKALEFHEVRLRFEFNKMKESAATLVTSTYFDYAICTIILLNALAIGIQTDIMARELSQESVVMNHIELIFLVVFTCELLVRILAYGGAFFTSSGWQWNAFDCILVGQQLVEHVIAAVAQQDSGMNLSFARVLRILRLVRVLRLARMLRLIRELRTLVSSITGSLKSLGWTICLLALMIYTVSLYITQAVSEERISGDSMGLHSDTLAHYYGSVPRTMLSLFEAITGGQDWEMLVFPLIDQVSPLLALLFLVYISFTLFAMMNVVTGVFVDSVLVSAKRDKDHVLVSNARELLRSVDGNRMTMQIFEDRVSSQEMQEFFKGIDVDASEAKAVFRVLDIDNSGEIDAEEFLSGCIRLRGHARALDVAVMLREVRMIRRCLKDVHRHKVLKQSSENPLKSNPSEQTIGLNWKVYA